MINKIFSTFAAAAMSMSIALAVPVGVTAVSSLTVVSNAQAAKIANASPSTNRRLHKKKSLAPRRGGNSNGPAVINCDIESSEECEKIVICSPNCSTDQMQGGDCC